MSEPIYNAKVNKIIELLKFMNRDEAAAKLNYKTIKSGYVHEERTSLLTLTSNSMFRCRPGWKNEERP